MDRFITRKETRERRQTQVCHTFTIKVDKSHLSQKSIRHLYNLFVEAKWFYNYCLTFKNVNDVERKVKEVPVKVSKKKEEDRFEIRKFRFLSSQMKQELRTRVFNNILSLSALKKKGHKVGWLKFKSILNSIPLVQYKKTFDINFEKSRVHIQGLKPWIKVLGLKQIPQEYEIASATLVRKANDYYVNVTTFENKIEKQLENESIGIDFGCETQLTLSNGIKIAFQIPISKRLKRLDRKIMKCDRKPSKKRKQDQVKRQKEYAHITNQKRDVRNKVVSAISTTYKYVCFQDESIHEWSMIGHGKKIQNSSIGSILSDLKSKSEVPIEVNKWFPSTQLCPQCGKKNKLSLDDRIYDCECGYRNDRDLKSSICIEDEGMKYVPAYRRDLKTREILSSTLFEKLIEINNIELSKVMSVI